MDTDVGSGGGASGGQSLKDDGGVQASQACSSDILTSVQSTETKLGALAENINGEVLVLIPLSKRRSKIIRGNRVTIVTSDDRSMRLAVYPTYPTYTSCILGANSLSAKARARLWSSFWSSITATVDQEARTLRHKPKIYDNAGVKEKKASIDQSTYQ